VFTTSRLAIEPLAVAHAEELHAALDHPEVHRYLPNPEVTTVAALRTRLEQLAATPPPDGERWWNFAVRLRADRTVIGRLEATTYDAWGEIAYVFGPRWWGRGLASEATRWLIAHLADHGADHRSAANHDNHHRCGLGIAELWAATHPDNTASQRLLLRLGFAAVDTLSRPLASFDPGDTVFVRRG
jgi:RimJ/RimL family protein N-acetyltransferase